MLMGKVLVDRNEAHHEILFELDYMQLQLKLVDHKLNLLAHKLVGMYFTNLDYPQPQVLIVEEHPPLV
jgi:hypothetical protein